MSNEQKLREALQDITDDYAERFDLDDPSTNPGIKIVIQQARQALATTVQAAPAVPQSRLLGYINDGHLHEIQSGRAPYVYVYAAPGVGAETPVYTTPPQEPAVPQGWKVERKSNLRIRVESPSGDALSFENVDDRGSSNLFVYQMLDAMLAAPSQERCCTCGYLTSEREHLGCLRKAVKDLDAATGGPYPSQPVNRPQNCGTSYCSCIECVCEPEPEPEPEPVTLTDSYAGVIAWIGDKQCKRVLTEGAIKYEHTPGVAMRNTAHQCVQEVIITSLREKE